VNGWLTLYNDTRFAYYSRDFATTVPSCSAGSTLADYAASCSGQFFAGLDPTLAFGGGNPGYRQRSWGIQDIGTAVANFRTGPFRHRLVAGFDVFHQEDRRDGYAVNGTKGPPSTIWRPVYPGSGYTIVIDPNDIKKSSGTDLALFASDRLWLTDELSILGGVRWDHYAAEYDQFTGTWARNSAKSSFFSPRASIIYEPTPDYTFYASYATSASPPGQFVANAPNPINGAQPNLEPETADSHEAGAKLNFFDKRLGVTGAVFQITKSNAYYTDPVTGTAIATGEEQRVRGFELGITGKPLPNWTVQLAYTHLQSAILQSANGYAGNEVAGVPHNAVSLWTTYEVPQRVLPQLHGKLTVGGGIVYRDEVCTRSDNTYIIPPTFSLDAVIAYEDGPYRIALNGYNLTDNLNYDAFFSNRAIPSAGRTLLVTASAKF
jgi:catecholate siderophore receptor